MSEGLTARKPSAKHAKRGDQYNVRGVRARKGEPKPGWTPEELEALNLRAAGALAEAGLYASEAEALERLAQLRAESKANSDRLKAGGSRVGRPPKIRRSA